MTISIEQAQRHLAELIEQLRAGEELVITRDGRTVARIIPESAGANGAHVRRPGSGKAMITSIAPDFDAPLDEFREYTR